MGYERWVNDTYWLAMPFKLRDPGANLKFARVEAGGGGSTTSFRSPSTPAWGSRPEIATGST